MENLQLQPDQVLSTHDFPVYNEHILKMYFRMAKHAPELVPPTPVIHVSSGLPLLPDSHEHSQQHNQALTAYLNKHPDVEYIMLDGSHKTTALALTHNPIDALIIRTNEDIRQMFAMVEKGELFGFNNPDTFPQTLLDIATHLSKSTDFQTISSKTRRMIAAKVIPRYMINHYQSDSLRYRYIPSLSVKP